MDPSPPGREGAGVTRLLVPLPQVPLEPSTPAEARLGSIAARMGHMERGLLAVLFSPQDGVPARGGEPPCDAAAARVLQKCRSQQHQQWQQQQQQHEPMENQHQHSRGHGEVPPRETQPGLRRPSQRQSRSFQEGQQAQAQSRPAEGQRGGILRRNLSMTMLSGTQRLQSLLSWRLSATSPARSAGQALTPASSTPAAHSPQPALPKDSHHTTAACSSLSSSSSSSSSSPSTASSSSSSASPSPPGPLQANLPPQPQAHKVFTPLHEHQQEEPQAERERSGEEVEPSAGGQGPWPASESLLCTPRLQDLFCVQHELGRGHLGVVSLVRCRASRRLFACKSIYRSALTKPRHVEEVKQEVLTMAELQLQHHLTLGPSSAPYMVRLHEVLDDAQGVHLIMDFCDGGDLLHHLLAKGRLSEAECRALLLQLLTGIQDLHRAGLVHRDIKPENILLARKQTSAGVAQPLASAARHVLQRAETHLLYGAHAPAPLQKLRGSAPSFKLADFGSTVRLDPAQRAQGLAGSPKYMAPEVVRGQEYGPEVDIWSLGVVLYCCLSGRQPFVGQAIGDVFHSVLSCTPSFTSTPWLSVSKEAKGLVSSMLCKEPRRRITVPEILKHPWVRGALGPGASTNESWSVPRSVSVSVES